MTKSFINEKRVIFPVGEQYKFLLEAKERVKISWTKFAKEIGVAKRTFNEWKNEKYSLPLGILKRICKIAKLKIPDGIEIKEPFWWTKMAGEKAGKMVYQKYGRIGGDPEYRKKKWYEWWEREGKFRKHPFVGFTKPIKKPHLSSDLAEFVGIIIGDGGITKKQIMVSLNRETEKCYSIFVKSSLKNFLVSKRKFIKKINQQLPLRFLVWSW
jgi:DNA-binding XRE family transcriptional regulator